MDGLIDTVNENFQDFAQIQQGYIQTMELLKKNLGQGAVQIEENAICQQIVSGILFSWVLGIQANYRYFSDPVSGNFLIADPEVYLRENISRSLPDYADAQQKRDEFYSQLNQTQKALYEPVREYVCYLETVGPKLAHYYGYVIGNSLLQRVIPGYQPDMAFTLQYCMELEKYFGKRLDLSKILKPSSLFC